MTNQQVAIAFSEAHNYQSASSFAAAMMDSSAFYNMEGVGPIPDWKLEEPLRRIWLVDSSPFPAFLDALDLTVKTCALRFCIPLHTVRDWFLDERTCPPFVRLMMAELTGYLDIR